MFKELKKTMLEELRHWPNFDCQLDSLEPFEMKASAEELPRSDWPVGTSVEDYLDFELLQEGPAHCGQGHSPSGALVVIRKLTEPEPGRRAADCAFVVSASSSYLSS